MKERSIWYQGAFQFSDIKTYPEENYMENGKMEGKASYSVWDSYGIGCILPVAMWGSTSWKRWGLIEKSTQICHKDALGQ